MLGPITTVLTILFASQSLEKAKTRSEANKSEDNNTVSNSEDNLVEDFVDSEEKNSEENNKTGLLALWDRGTTEVGKIMNITSKTFSGTKNLGDFLNKQNYIANSVIADGFSFDGLEDLSDSWEELRENKNSGYKYTESSLNEEEQKEAREYAIQLLKDRYDENLASYPDYGDVRKYYNEGSLADWVLTHPVSFGLNAIAEASDENGEVTTDSIRGDETDSDNWYKTVSQDVLGKDGVFTVFNIPTYIAHNNDGEVRQDSCVDMLGNIKSSENIDKALDEYQTYITELENSIDDPEKFAEIYYNATEGMNFNPDNVLEYKNNTENGKDNELIDTIIGRNYISEDLGKNEMMTNIVYEVNKTIGTKLCDMIPFVGPVIAGIINVGVTVAEEKTQNNSEITTGEWFKIILNEGILRNLVVNNKIDIFKNNSANIATKSVARESTETTNSLIGDIVDGNNVTGDIVETFTTPKAVVKSAFKIVFNLIKGIFAKS